MTDQSVNFKPASVGSGHADAHLGNRKNSVIGGNHNVTSGDHSDTATETGTLHQRDCWNRKGVEPLDRLCGHPRGAQIILRWRASDRVEPIDIGASLKIPALADDHDRTQSF